MAQTVWRLIPNADVGIKMDLLGRGQRYCPRCGVQLNPENCEVYKREEISTSSDDDLRRRLREWRSKKGKELGVDQFQSGGRVISNAIIDRLVDTRPINVEELQNVRGIGHSKVNEFGAEILAIIKDGNPPDETYEELSQQLDELMLFCRDCSERGISAATWPQGPKPGSQIATLSGDTECAIIRVDTGKKISDHFKISKHFRGFP